MPLPFPTKSTTATTTNRNEYPIDPGDGREKERLVSLFGRPLHTEVMIHLHHCQKKNTPKNWGSDCPHFFSDTPDFLSLSLSPYIVTQKMRPVGPCWLKMVFEPSTSAVNDPFPPPPSDPTFPPPLLPPPSPRPALPLLSASCLRAGKRGGRGKSPRPQQDYPPHIVLSHLCLKKQPKKNNKTHLLPTSAYSVPFLFRLYDIQKKYQKEKHAKNKICDFCHL